MGDVRKRATVDKGGITLERLDQVGLDGVLEKYAHGALGADVVDGDGPAIEGVGHAHAAQAGLEVCKVGSQAEDGHDLGGDGDVETILASHAVG